MYNASKYIEKCASTLFEQTLESIEYIFVNDKSTDNTVDLLNDIISRYPHRKSDVKIINLPQNSGQAIARSTGILHASGEYIIHCDCDDWVDTKMYEILYNKAKQDDLDCVTCNFYESDGENYRVQSIPSCANLFEAILSGDIHAALWNKLYKSSLFCRSRFIPPKGNMGEDFIINLQFSYNVKRVAHIDTPLYYYYYNATSITRDPNIKRVLSRFEQSVLNIAPLKEFLIKNNLFKKHYYQYISIVAIKREILSKYIHIPDIYRIWKNTHREINKYLLISPKIKLKRKIRFVLNLCRIPY